MQSFFREIELPVHNIYIIITLIGAAIGSFLNVCIYRIPRELSIVTPASRCPGCDKGIKPYDNIPIISYLILIGRCRECKTKISFRYPLIEGLNTLLYVTALWRFGLGWHLIPIFAFCSAMVVITFIDMDFQIIPNIISIPGAVVGLLAGAIIFPDIFKTNQILGFWNSLTGLVIGGSLFLLVALLGEWMFNKEAMGMGDVKMMAMVGAFLGWKGVVLTTFTGSLAGTIVSIFMMVYKGKDRHSQIPFGPFLAAGALITLFYGKELLSLYLRRAL